MRRLALIVCLLIGTVAAHAQFEKGKWFVNPSVTGLNFSYNTETDKAHFGLEVKGGAFLIDNVALLLDAGATWQGGGTDVYTLGVGGRYYFNKIGVFLGADVNLNRYNWDGGDKTRFGSAWRAVMLSSCRVRSLSSLPFIGI